MPALGGQCIGDTQTWVMICSTTTMILIAERGSPLWSHVYHEYTNEGQADLDSSSESLRRWDTTKTAASKATTPAADASPTDQRLFSSEHSWQRFVTPGA